MAASSNRTIAPKRNMSAHAQMLSTRQSDSSPIFPTPVKYESPLQSPIHLEMPASNGRSSPYVNVVGATQHFRSIPSQCSESDGGVIITPFTRSPRLKLHLTPRQTNGATSMNGREPASSFTTPSDNYSSPSGSPSSGLKLKLRGIQAALRSSSGSDNGASPQSASSSSRKRTSVEASFEEEDDTDSEIDIMPPSRMIVKVAMEKSSAHTAARRQIKKVKNSHRDSDSDYHGDSDFDAGDEGSSPANNLVLSSNVLKRSERMLDPNNPEHAALIAATPKAGSEYYDSDAEDLPGNAKDTSKPHLFRNVSWGAFATDYSDPHAFTTEPELWVFPTS
ncbi:hypothetical protein OPT61_g72 [Boeremia exigua]|uniref:Uncharacterized protein n=1 Tax=Boeremia exigua TaxID=749465 RepID=A0ACC2IVH6_9PLEO|nr:hypothetical protein OPT61_g72 [Boeremia exigua]